MNGWSESLKPFRKATRSSWILTISPGTCIESGIALYRKINIVQKLKKLYYKPIEYKNINSFNATKWMKIPQVIAIDVQPYRHCTTIFFCLQVALKSECNSWEETVILTTACMIMLSLHSFIKSFQFFPFFLIRPFGGIKCGSMSCWRSTFASVWKNARLMTCLKII